MYGPTITPPLRLIISELAKFRDYHGVDLTRDAELYSAAQFALVPYISGDKLSKPVNYCRDVIRQAFLDVWQKSPDIYIPPSTRRDMVNRGEEPHDPACHSWQQIMKSDALPRNKPGNNNNPCWKQPVAKSEWAQWQQIIATLEVVYSLCRDDLDRAIVDARLGDFMLGDPVHVDDVAVIVGLSVYEVNQRLDRLERRACQALNRRIPDSSRKQMPKGSHAGCPSPRDYQGAA